MIKKMMVCALVSAVCALASAQDFTEQEVRVVNHADGIVLAGTLTLPAEGKPRAAVVMITGSGSQNRDEEIFGHKPFKRIAERLSGEGVAVLRMDDRGNGESEGDFASATTTDFLRDISAGISFMDSCFSAVPVGVIGHSEGGSIAVRLGARNPECDFIVTMAAPAWAGDSIIMSQSRALATAMTGRWDAETQQRRILDIAKSNKPAMLARMEIYAILAETVGEAAKLSEVQKALTSQVDGVLSPWYREMLRYDPADDIKAVNVPWLALNGDKDVQVLPGNLSTIKELNQAAEVRLLPGLNHLFQNCTTGLPQEYQSISEDIAPAFLNELSSWFASKAINSL